MKLDTDFNDMERINGQDAVRCRIDSAIKPDLPNADEAHDNVPAYVNGLNPVTAEQLLHRRFEKPECILEPWLPTKGLTMVYGERGIGKTHVSLGIGVAAASGGKFLRWSTPRPFRVLLIDGEMPGHMLQERFARTVDRMDADMRSDAFQIVAADFELDGLPDLADPHSQNFFGDVVAGADLVIVDNLSTICRSLRENEADSWGPVQAWALQLRRQGKSVVFVHHSGKGGGQRGTSRKEDVLNSVIALRRPPEYTADQGARFEVHYEKARGFHGPDAEPFEAWLRDDQWTVGPVMDGHDDESLRAFHEQGLSYRDIEKRTGVPKSTIARRLKGEIR